MSFGKRPAGGVHDEPLPVLLGPDFPQLLQADAIDLGIDAFAQAVALLKLFAQIAAAPFGKQRVLRVQLHARLIRIGRLAFAIDAHVAGDDAFHDTRVAVQNLRSRKSGEDLHAERFGLLCEPPANVPETDDVIAVVLETAG